MNVRRAQIEEELFCVECGWPVVEDQDGNVPMLCATCAERKTILGW